MTDLKKLNDFQLLIQCETAWPDNVKALIEAIGRDIPGKMADTVFVVVSQGESGVLIECVTKKASVALRRVVEFAEEYGALEEDITWRNGLPYYGDDVADMGCWVTMAEVQDA